MRTIARFDAPEDAYLFRSFLSSRGIETSVLDEYVTQWFWTHRQAFGGTRVVLMDEEDLIPACEAGEEYFAALKAKPAMTTEVRGWPVVALLSLMAGVPMPIFGRRKLGTDAEEDAAADGLR
jgi:hypothetical protein